MSIEENKAIIKKFDEEMAKDNIDIADEVYSPNFVHHNAKGTMNFEEIKELWRGVFDQVLNLL